MQRRTLLAALPLLGTAPLAWAQGRSTRLIVPFPPAGATDVVGRVVAEALARELGSPVVVDNRSGAGGSLGTAELVKAAPDGNTLAIATVSTHAVNPVAYRNLSYKPERDFTYVSELARAPGVMVVNPAVPARTLEEFVRYAKKNPGRLTYGSAGIGSAGHIVTEIFKSSTGTFMLHVPYRGASGVITDLLGGQLDMCFDQVASALPHIQSGRLRALAVSWNARLPMLPDVPTFGELGYFANNNASWFGLVGPANMKPETTRSLNAAVKRVLAQPEVKNRFEKLGLYASWSGPEEFAATVNKEVLNMGRTARIAKISLD
ncbi:MAG: tripartite tricarboxylate transporter substrate binding protein [Burkholderiales bacterium]|nr:tripartite tricarboxylate transporter substrate binding protein [Burkholderiales bacterium]